MPFSRERSEISSSKQKTNTNTPEMAEGLIIIIIAIITMSYGSHVHFSPETLKSKKENQAGSTVRSFPLSTFSSDAIWHISVLAFVTNMNRSHTTVSPRLAKHLWFSLPCSLFMKLSIAPHSWQWCLDYHGSVSDHIFQLYCKWELLIWGYQQTNCLSLTMPHEEV